MKAEFLFLICLVFFSACKESSSEKKLGRVDLEVNCNEAAKEYFNRGLLYLHSFEYRDARTEFIKAQQADPSCGMAYWGEIMAYNHPLFFRQLPSYAVQSFERMGATHQERERLFTTEMERDLLRSIEILFGPGNKQDRDKAYRSFFERLAKKYPGNHEIAAFYCLSLLSSPKTEKTADLYDKAASIAQGILDENPEHPGALHYLIHAYDYPTNAHKAIDAADRYANVAPDAAHALHMPSHIYFALGRWDDVVESNIESWNASVSGKYIEPRKQLSYHSLSWLHYALLQLSDIKLATEMIQDMMWYALHDKSVIARSYMVSMKGAHMVGADIWDGEIADLEVKTDDLHLTRRSAYNYLDGLKAYRDGDIQKIEVIIDRIADERYIASLDLGEEFIPMCNTAGNPSIPPNQSDIDLVRIMELQLEARLKQLQRKEGERLKLLEEAASLFGGKSNASGPPIVFKPIFEDYAEALMENNQFQKALIYANKGLESSPGNMIYYKIKKEIAMKTNQPEVLKEMNDELAILDRNFQWDEILSFRP